MTFAIFFSLFIIFLIAVLNWLPVAGALPTVFITAVSTVVGYMKAWNFFFPITELLWCVAIIAVYEIAVWGIAVMQRIIRIIRGGNAG